MKSTQEDRLVAAIIRRCKESAILFMQVRILPPPPIEYKGLLTRAIFYGYKDMDRLKIIAQKRF